MTRGKARASLWVAALTLGATMVTAAPAALAQDGAARPDTLGASSSGQARPGGGAEFGAAGAANGTVNGVTEVGSASLGGGSAGAAPAASASTYVTSIRTDRTIYVVGQRITGYVTLNRAAGSKGITGTLTTTIPGLVPGGKLTGTFKPGFRSGQGFSLPTTGVKGPVSGTITVTIGGHSARTKIKINNVFVTSISTDRSTYTVGDRISGNVTLNGAAGPKGITGTLSSTIPGLIPGGKVTGTFPAGFHSGPGFSIPTTGIKGPVTGTLTVTIGGHSVRRTIKINNLFVTSISTDRTAYAEGQRISGYVTLNGTAGANGVTGTLTSTIPGLIPGGTMTGTFPVGFHSGPGFSIPTTGIKGPVTGTITVTIGGHSAHTTVTIG